MSRARIWINACEASSDFYGALLMRELQHLSPEIEIMGMGGQAMRAQGLQTVYPSEELSLVGLTEVFSALPKIALYLRRIKRILRQQRPGVLVLMDAPDFNFRLAKMASKLGIPVVYYIAPQVWAWRKSRLGFLKKYVSHIACIFPFEQEFFQEHGLAATYVGHPLMEVLDTGNLESRNADISRVAILPGSRKKEIASLLPLFISVARELRQAYPNLFFGVVQAPGVNTDFLHKYLPEEPFLDWIAPENRHSFLSQSSLALAASGTVTLECAILDVPTIVAYKLSWISYMVGRLLIDVPYISMPNLILKRPVFPEFIQSRAHLENILHAARVWLDNPQEKEFALRDLEKVRNQLGEQRATPACAQLILDTMSPSPAERP